jgi:hypothetical protein
MAGDQIGGVGGVESDCRGLDGERRMSGTEPLGRRFDLPSPEIGGAMQELAVKIGAFDPIGIDETKPADAGGREGVSDRATERADAHHEDGGIRERSAQ